MLVSIITVCYNSEKTIRKTIESVLNQTYCSIEYLIIDGMSRDATVTIARSYIPDFQKKGFRYDIFSETDHGIYEAMNKGIERSSGDIIGIINSDDWYELHAVQTVVNSYNDSPFDMFYADVRLITHSGKELIKHSRRDTLVTSRHWNHPTSFVTKALYNELGLFKCKGIHDDFDFLLRVRRAGKMICIKSVILANFMAGGASNEKNLVKTLNRIQDRYTAYRENGYSRLYLFECLVIEIAKLLIS